MLYSLLGLNPKRLSKKNANSWVICVPSATRSQFRNTILPVLVLSHLRRFNFKKQGLPEKNLDTWLKKAGWEAVLNRKGTSWRKLSPSEQASVVSGASARPYLLVNPSLIKRPVIEWLSDKGTEITVGYQPDQWLAR